MKGRSFTNTSERQEQKEAELGTVLVGFITVKEACMTSHVGRLRGSVAALGTLVRLLARVCPTVLR